MLSVVNLSNRSSTWQCCAGKPSAPLNGPSPRLPMCRYHTPASLRSALDTHHQPSASTAELGMDLAELSVTAELIERTESKEAQLVEAAEASTSETLSQVPGCHPCCCCIL